MPLEHGSGGDGCGFEAFDGGWGGASYGEGGVGEAGGVAGGVLNFDAVVEQGDGVGGEGRGEGIGGGAYAGVDGYAEGGGARGCRYRGFCWCGGLELGGFSGGCLGCGDGGAADAGGEVAFEEQAVGGFCGGGPVEEHLVADALGGEVGDGLGEVERGWARRPRTGAAGDEQ